MSKKNKTLKQQFYTARRQLLNRLIYESAREGQMLSHIPFFKHFDYETIAKQGITRNVRGRTVRYYGAVAIRKVINAYRNRALSIPQKSKFIFNYTNAMLKAGYPPAVVEDIERLMNKTSQETLGYLIRKGLLPQIEYIYGEEQFGEMLDRIYNALENPPIEEIREERRRTQIYIETQQRYGFTTRHFLKHFEKKSRKR